VSHGIYLVLWRDASYSLEEEEEREDYIVHSVGWCDPEGAGLFLVLHGEITPDGVRAVRRIPRSSIIGEPRLLSERPVTGSQTLNFHADVAAEGAEILSATAV
jgi:hypothetical protein